MKFRTPLAAAGVSVLLLAACGDDDDAGGSAQAYCDMSAELNDVDEVPSGDQLDELVDTAPSEIRSEVQTLVDAVESGEFDDSVSEAEQAITEFEESNCGGDLAAGDDAPSSDEAEPGAIVTFGSLENGSTVSNPIVFEPTVSGATIAEAGEVAEGEGHYHVMIDAECVPSGESIPKDDNHVHFGDGSTTLELPELEPGEHELCIQLGNGFHEAFGAAQTISITVE